VSILWIALRLILGVNIGVDNAGCRTGVIWGGPPRILQQFDLAQFLQGHATPILGEPIGAKPLSLSPPY